MMTIEERLDAIERRLDALETDKAKGVDISIRAREIVRAEMHIAARGAFIPALRDYEARRG